MEIWYHQILEPHIFFSTGEKGEKIRYREAKVEYLEIKEKQKSMTSWRRNLNLLIPHQQRILLSTADNKIEVITDILFLVHIGIYIAILGVLTVLVLLIIKFLGDSCNNIARETEALVPEPEKIIGLPYGTDDEDSYKTGVSSSSDDLYDGKICVICYDVLRDCFFVPCGHCAMCFDCAMRIMEGENKVCPICRKIIHKVRRLLMP